MKPAPDLAEQDRTLPPELAQVVTKMLAKKPENRYQTPADVIAALAPWLSDDEEHKVVVGLSGTDEGQSGSLRNTIAGKRTKRIEQSPEKSEESKKRKRHRQMWIGGGVGAFLLVTLIAWAAWPSSKQKVDPTATAAVPTALPAASTLGDTPGNTPPPPPPPLQGKDNSRPVVTPVIRGNAQVAITEMIDHIQIKTAKYEAIIEKADGCLSSFRVEGTEFLRNGGPLSAGRTKARGGFFHCENNGHEGLVKLPDIQYPAPTVIVAAGNLFNVRYEFNPTSLTITGQNSTSDTVPYYLIFDSEFVNDVKNVKGEQLAVPATKSQDDNLDPAWRTTTWYAGRASVKVTDQTYDAATKVWGPFSPYKSQVWQSSAKARNHIQFTLEPSVAEELSPQGAPGGIVMYRAGNTWQIRTELYETTVDKDGCMPTLRINGVEMLKPSFARSRGLYLFSQPMGTALPDIKQHETNAILAQSDGGAILYQFTHNKIICTTYNKTSNNQQFAIIMDPSCVTGVQNEQNAWSKLPVGESTNTPGTGIPATGAWETTTWYAGRAKFKLTGCTRLRTWQGNGHQVCEAVIASKEERVITLDIGLTDAAEAAKLGEITGVKPALASDLILDTPRDYQVFQRRTKLQGNMTIRGRMPMAYDRLEMRTLGKSLQGLLPDQWREIPLAEKKRLFEASIPMPAGGWYKLEVRAIKDGKVVGQTVVDHVGVGEVFIGAGQSNSTNSGKERTQQKSGMVSSFNGNTWQLADDPQLGIQDNSIGGSCWPAFGDAMFEAYQVPIGIASTGHAGASVNQWAPESEVCRWTSTRMRQLGPYGFRAVLWHQGESDVGMTTDDYVRKMTALIRETQKVSGWEVPWFVAQVSYQNPNKTSSPNPRAAQKKLWDMGIAFEGPDTDTLTGDNRDNSGKGGMHFSPKGLRAHGQLWARKVTLYMDKELAK
jgi:hypothetical protein